VKYRTLNRKEDAPKDAVNDWMQGFVVSDSDPLSTEDLVLCQKVDRKPDGTENRHAILRESIKPGTAIRFTITVDTSVCHLDKQILANALRTVITDYHRNFRMAFAGMPALKTNYLYLGGGSGFVSKTIVYSAYGKNMGIDLTQRIFDKIKVPREHRHSKDKEYGVSPHTLKCTYYQRERLEMGLCKVEKFRLLNP
jgi:CRISPR-associated protein Csm5